MTQLAESFDKPHIVKVLRTAQSDGEERGFAFATGDGPHTCVFLTDLRKGPQKLLAALKKSLPDAGQPTMGTMRVEEGTVYLAPKRILPGMQKQLRKRFKLEGIQKFEVVILDEDGNAVEESDDEGECAADAPAAASDAAEPEPAADVGPPPDPRVLTYRKAIAAFAKHASSLPGDRRGPIIEELRRINEVLAEAPDQAALDDVGETLTELKQKLAAAPAPASDVSGQAQKAAKVLGPHVLAALEAAPDRKTELAGLLKAVVNAQSLEALTVAVGALKTALSRTSAGQGFSIKALGASRIRWDQVRRDAADGVDRIKQVVTAVYEDQPEPAAAVNGALSRLDTAIDRLSADLRDDLDMVLNAPSPDAAGPQIAKARGRVAEFIKLIESDPILVHLDNNEFTPDIAVIGPLQTNLGEISAALSA